MKPTAADFASWNAATSPKPAPFGVCVCGRGIESHSRIKPSGNPEFQYVCAYNGRDIFQAQDGSTWPHGPAAGLT